RTKAVETNLVLEVHQTCVRLGIEIRGRNADLEFVLQSFGDRFLHLHGVNLLPAFVRQTPAIYNLVTHSLEAGAGGSADPILQGNEPLRTTDPPVIVMRKRCRRLVRAEGLEPPQLSSLEPKSSASTSSATPADSIMFGRDAAGAGLITWAHPSAAKKWQAQNLRDVPAAAGHIQ